VGCPTVGVRTGASFLRTGETGVVVDRLAPGQKCVETDEDEWALAVFMEAIEQAQTLDRHSVRDRAGQEFDTDRMPWVAGDAEPQSFSLCPLCKVGHKASHART